MARRTLPQRELRNDIAAILREAAAGTEITVTARRVGFVVHGPTA